MFGFCFRRFRVSVFGLIVYGFRVKAKLVGDNMKLNTELDQQWLRKIKLMLEDCDTTNPISNIMGNMCNK